MVAQAGAKRKKFDKKENDYLLIYDIIPIILFALSRKCQMRKE